MFEDVRDLYSAAILERSRAPRHAGRPAAFDWQARGDNPMCGDRVTVYLRGTADLVREAAFEARGCELTKASADLMCDAVAGRSAADVRALAAAVEGMAHSGDCACGDAALQGLKPLGAVHEYPSRVRCVTLPWSALIAALDGAEESGLE